jgi:thioredoxin 1
MSQTQEQINEALAGEGKTLLHFTAEWCGPCKKMIPVIQDLLEQDKTIKYVQINVDDNPKIASDYGVQTIPTFIAFDGAKRLNTNIGAVPLPVIKKLFEE